MTPNDLAAELLAVVLEADPLTASFYGVPGYDDRLPDFASHAEKSFHDAIAAIAQGAKEFPDDGLDEAGLSTLDFVRYMAEGMAAAASVPLIEFTICDIFSSPVSAVLSSLPKLALDTTIRKEGYLARLREMPALLEVAATRHSEGVRSGRSAVARLVGSAIAQLDFMIADPSMAAIVREETGDPDFERDVKEAVDTYLRPGLAKYRDFIKEEILPHSRDENHPGICHIEGGEEMYRALSRWHTSTVYSPEELHEMGKEIVAQVREELREAGTRYFHTTEVSEIFNRLSNDPDLRYQSREEMLAHAERAVRAAEAAAPQWFATVPVEPCSILPVPGAEEQGSPPAYYIPGAFDGSRASTYFLNTLTPQKRHRYMAEDIAFHEAVPGHHFQFMIALESKDLVPARQILSDTACAEGWGLYAERLADEMGLYSDELARMGLFTADSWRASRLVVDTGLHAMGWTRAQAVEWMATNTPLPQIEIDAEVDRYISYPGQALAYMVGRREIVRLRNLCSETLGDRFDLRAFHDVILRAGIMPLSALSHTVERWLARSAQ